jgi:hypothetical protein
MSVKIVTDSSCDLPDELVSQFGIDVVPLTIRFGAEELVDRADLTPAEFWARCATSAELPSTAAPAPGAFEEVFRKAAAAGAEGVMCVVLSSKLSATGESAQAAARAVADVVPVKVVDSLSVSLGHGMMAVQGARRAADGATLDEIVAMAEDMARRTKIFATLDTLEYLKRGGRIGAARPCSARSCRSSPVSRWWTARWSPGPSSAPAPALSSGWPTRWEPRKAWRTWPSSMATRPTSTPCAASWAPTSPVRTSSSASWGQWSGPTPARARSGSHSRLPLGPVFCRRCQTPHRWGLQVCTPSASSPAATG